MYLAIAVDMCQSIVFYPTGCFVCMAQSRASRSRRWDVREKRRLLDVNEVRVD